MWIFFWIVWQLPGILGKLYVAPVYLSPYQKKWSKLISRNIIVSEFFIIFNLKKEMKKEIFFFMCKILGIYFWNPVSALSCSQTLLKEGAKKMTDSLSEWSYSPPESNSSYVSTPRNPHTLHCLISHKLYSGKGKLDWNRWQNKVPQEAACPKQESKHMQGESRNNDLMGLKVQDVRDPGEDLQKSLG